jgi:hypothetical protein
MLITVGSVKGSPGATTLALLLAATWPASPPGRRPIVVEADCAGGDLGGRCLLPDSPGLTSLATAARAGRAVLSDHVTRLPLGVDAAVAPASQQASTVAIGLLAEVGVAAWLGDQTGIADVGRLDPGAPSNELVSAADAVVLVSSGDAASLLRLADTVLARERTHLVLVGACAYSTQEVEEGVGLPVAAVLPWDPRAARMVWGTGAPGRAWTRRGLPAAVRALADRLVLREPAAEITPAEDTADTPEPRKPPAGLPRSSAGSELIATPSTPGIRT